ncbi:MAG: glutamate-5-semialdehyde dehydrogenase [Lentisphaeria bacterium]|nr:glutamate-5-semialdehyde dehydrogenase [Lentisphaeria bacterium]
MTMQEMAAAAKQASIQAAVKSSQQKNEALRAIADILTQYEAEIIAANQRDLAAAEKSGLAMAALKRLQFDSAKLIAVVAGVESLLQLPDPVGQTLSATELDTGLELYKVSCPIGVIGVIFESRPDALVQISTLCLKSGNAALLKGGAEALHTNRILARLISQASVASGMPENWLQLLESRAEVGAMLKLDDYIDLIVPRGSNAFVRYIKENTSIAVLGHADGICHVYVDAAADLGMARSIVIDSKCQYVSVCNAAETLLVHKDIAAALLPQLLTELKEHGVQVLGCPETRALIDVPAASEEDWKTEYLDYILSIRIVPDLASAVQHINQYGSGHTEVIVSENAAAAANFMGLVDAGDVFWNCSSRFSDGYRYGLGAEVGISTNKIHARGPVGLEGLMIYKWLLKGQGHIVADYAEGRRHFTHRKLTKNYSNP